MKTKVEITNLLVATAFVLTMFTATAKESQPQSYTAILRGVPAAEIPAKAASCVLLAKSEEQTAVAVAVVRAAVELSPFGAPAIVGAIARVAPHCAPATAAEAARLQPKLASAIAKTAAFSAPNYAGEIVFAVCKELPTQYSTVTIEVAHVVPGARQSILFQLGEAIPALKPFLERAKSLVSAGRSTTPSVSVIVDETADLVGRAENQLRVERNRIVLQGLSSEQQTQLTAAKRKSVPGKSRGKSPKQTKKKTHHKTPKKKSTRDYSKP